MVNTKNNIFAMLSYDLRQQLEQAAKSPLLLVLFFASILLSIASFYTTFSGMLHFMPIILISLFITFAIQALLFATAWYIGFMWVGKQEKDWLIVSIFIICFVVSVFFSVSSIFNFIFDPTLQKSTRMTRIHNAVGETISDLETESQQRRKELVEVFLGTSAYDQWYKNVQEVAKIAVQGKEKLRDSLRERANRQALTLQEMQQAVSNSESEKNDNKSSITGSKNKIKRLSGESQRLEEQIIQLKKHRNSKETDIFNKEKEMEKEDKIGGEQSNGEQRPAGKGKVWTSLEKKRNTLNIELDGIIKQLKYKEEKLDALNSKKEKLKNLITTNKAKLASIDTDINNKKQQVDTLKNEYGSLGSQEYFDATTLVAKLRKNLAKFGESFELKPFKAAATICDSLLSEMRGLEDLRANASTLSCDRGALSMYINPINQSIQSLSRLEKDCLSGGENSKIITNLKFNDSVEYARHCIGISALPTNILRPLRNEISRLVREEDPKSSGFTKTSNAMAAGEKLAWYALILAFIIDILILFSGLMGAKSAKSDEEEDIDIAFEIDLKIHSNDNHKIKIKKYLLKYSESIAGNIEEKSIDLDSIEKTNIRDGIKILLDVYVGNKSAKRISDSNNIFYINESVFTQVRKKLNKEMLIRNNEKKYGKNTLGGATKASSSLLPVEEKEEEIIVTLGKAKSTMEIRNKVKKGINYTSSENKNNNKKENTQHYNERKINESSDDGLQGGM